MPERIARFKCSGCKVENEADFKEFEKDNKDRKIGLVCGSCGIVNEADFEEAKKAINNNSWLPCLVFDGPEKGLPAGEIITADGKHYYITAEGQRLTRWDFISLKGCDPSVVWPIIRPKWSPITVGSYGRKRLDPVKLGKKW